MPSKEQLDPGCFPKEEGFWETGAQDGDVTQLRMLSVEYSKLPPCPAALGKEAECHHLASVARVGQSAVLNSC
ncbi:hypothetical protein Y1Q_0016537 [Alligator mississippiensis]|uniref:Uncharacterized protein n=1 Tax=Alligator mississippiensis TaxID=8496 RepID=A0A151N335_ALLMI|nr:hypothetical protein Y1Q_0016537 [Alligator mississippiensis]